MSFEPPSLCLTILPDRPFALRLRLCGGGRNVGWRDRDWAQLDKSERKTFYGRGGTRPARAAGPARALLLALLVSLALAFAAGHYPRGHPLVPALAFKLTFTSPHVSNIKTIAVSYGSTYTLTGTTRGAGTVEADGSWNGGPWQYLTSGTATGDSYVLRFPITGHGTLKLKVKYPGGEAEGEVLVP